MSDFHFCARSSLDERSSDAVCVWDWILSIKKEYRLVGTPSIEVARTPKSLVDLEVAVDCCEGVIPVHQILGSRDHTLRSLVLYGRP